MSQTIQETKENPTFMKPLVDIFETKGEIDAIVLVADLPGINKENIDIQFHDGQLTIEGLCEEREGETLFHEFQYNGFRRTFAIQEKLDADNITADIKDGVLTVTMPKSPDLKVRQIAINA